MTGGVAAWARAFWRRAYREGVTGLAAMVAYNLVLSVFPFSLLVLFVFGEVLGSAQIEATVVRDLQRLFPDAEQQTLREVVGRVRANAGTLGLVAGIAGLWIGTSFWGAMDTAFCRVYHVPCRSWLAQKRWALGMLVVVVLLLIASVALPSLQGLLIAGARDALPRWAAELDALLNLALLAGAYVLLFAVAALIYWLVPSRRPPWRGIWPGALAFTVFIGLLNWLFPLYLTDFSSISRFGATAAFVLIALVWFYLISLSLLAGAVLNALRWEQRDTGTLPEAG